MCVLVFNNILKMCKSYILKLIIFLLFRNYPILISEKKRKKNGKFGLIRVCGSLQLHAMLF